MSYAAYVRTVREAVYASDLSINVPFSLCVAWPNFNLGADMVLFRDADGDFFAAAWRGYLVLDEAPFEGH